MANPTPQDNLLSHRLHRLKTTVAGVVATGADMVLASVQTVTGAKTFLDGKLLLQNVANTFYGVFTNANTANRTYTLPDSSGTLVLGGGTCSGTCSGTNTGDQTSIVGISGTLAQFNTACSDADFASGGGTCSGACSGTNTGDQVTMAITTSPGADTTAYGITGTVTVDTNSVGFGSALVLAADGHYDEADADSATTMPCTAIAISTGTGSKAVLFEGFVRNDAWAWTAGSPLYVSATVGTFTHTAPSTSGQQVQKIGYAYTADIIYFKPDMLVIEV